jgi:F-type H+-transporting ATPase subunit delta
VADRAIARRYAKAFLELADEAGRIDAIGAELDRILATIDERGGTIYGVLGNPGFTLDERRGLLKAVAPRLGITQLTTNLLFILLEKGRVTLLPEVTAQFHEFADEKANRVRVKVETAEALTPALAAEVKAALEQVTGKTVAIEVTVDPSLIGGIVARVGGRVYDASVRTRLDIIKQRLLNSRTPAQA